MNPTQKVDILKKCLYCGKTMLPKLITALTEAQAEISFKAGMKEVVEWVKASGDASLYTQQGEYTDEWQAKLKEWGLC